MTNRIRSEKVYRIDHLPGEEIDLNQEFQSLQSVREYDEAGRLITEISYTRDGEISDKMEYRHDAEGRLIETLIFGEFDDVLERRMVTWGDGNRINRETVQYQDGSEDIHEFFYDEKGNLTGIQVSDDEEELEFTESYFYDGDHVVRVERRDEEDELVFWQEDEYSGDILKKRTIWSAEEENPYTVVQHYDDEGNRTEELRYDSKDRPVERNTYEMDSKGQVIRLVEENKIRKNTTEFSYDEAGNVIYQKETDLHGNLNHEIYRFFSPEGDLIRTTVEAVIRPSMEKRAYSLIHYREWFEEQAGL